jgi:hypothetical protein
MKTISVSVFRLLFLLIVISFLGIGSCKKKAVDPDYCGTTWVTQVSAELNAVSAAATTYGTTPTTENCNALKTAYQNYLNVLEPFVDCASWTTQQTNELQDAIDEAQQQIDTLCD